MACGGRYNGLADTRVSFYLLFNRRRPLLNAAVPTRAFFHRVAMRWREAAGTSAQTFNLNRSRMTRGTLTEGLVFSLEARLTSAPGVHSQSDQKQFCFFLSFLPSSSLRSGLSADPDPESFPPPVHAGARAIGPHL